MAPLPFPALEGVLACQHTWSAMMHHTSITASKQHNLTESSAYAALHLCFIGTSGDSPSLPAVLSLALVAPLGDVGCHHTRSAMMHQTPINASKQHNLTESSAYAALHLCCIGTSEDSPSLPAVLSLALVAPFGDVGCHHTRSAMMHQTPINASKQHNLTESSAYARFYEGFNAMCDFRCARSSPAFPVPCGAATLNVIQEHTRWPHVVRL